MTILLIDDLRNFTPVRSSLVARTSASALAILMANPETHYTEIWLDHDLGLVDGKPDTIMKIVDYMCEQTFNGNPVNVDTVFVHTSNPVGGKQMVAGLQRYGYNVIRVQASDYFNVSE